MLELRGRRPWRRDVVGNEVGRRVRYFSASLLMSLYVERSTRIVGFEELSLCKCQEQNVDAEMMCSPV